MITTFMHYRKYDNMGQIEARGGLTLAIKADGNRVQVALAQCGRKDVFSRKRGRIIAQGRLEAGNPEQVIEMTLPPETVVKSFVHNSAQVRERVEKLLAGGK